MGLAVTRIKIKLSSVYSASRVFCGGYGAPHEVASLGTKKWRTFLTWHVCVKQRFDGGMFRKRVNHQKKRKAYKAAAAAVSRGWPLARAAMSDWKDMPP